MADRISQKTVMADVPSEERGQQPLSTSNQKIGHKRGIAETRSAVLHGDYQQATSLDSREDTSFRDGEDDKRNANILRPAIDGTGHHLLDLNEWVEERWPQDVDKEGYDAIVADMKNQPYLAQYIQEITGGDATLTATLTSEDRALLHQIRDKQTREIVQQALEAKNVRADFLRKCSGIAMKATKVNMQLLFLSGLSQAEAVSKSSKRSRASVVDGVMIKNLPSGFKSKFAEPSTIIESITENTESIDVVLHGLTNVGVNTGESEKRLVSMSTFFDKYLETAEILLKDDTNYEAKVQNAVNDLANTGTFQDIATMDKKIASMNEKYVPGPWAHETDGTQPWLQLILQKIGECLDSSPGAPPTPLRKLPRREAPICQTLKRPKRTVDFLLQREGRWRGVVLDHHVILPMEVKPWLRESNEPPALLISSIEQLLSLLAKYLYVGFYFDSWGVPCHATGIVATAAYVQVLQLRYENVGTPEAKLTLYQSDLLPLMTKDNFVKWASAQRGEKDAQFQDKLYGEDGKGGIDTAGVPLGVRAIFNLMKERTKNLQGLSVGISEQNHNFGDLLGTGATSVVFACSGVAEGVESSVIKMSRFGDDRDIKNEVDILKALSTGTPNNFIPKVVDSLRDQKIEIELGSVVTKLPAVKITPQGKAASNFFCGSIGLDEPLLFLVYKCAMSALNHMHSQEIIHRDVSPKNFIITEDEPKRVIVIDYSLARKSRRKGVTGFEGTANYAHSEVFFLALNNRVCHPRIEHDKVGLGYSLVYFANQCVSAWNVHPFPKKVSSKAKEALKKNMAELEAVLCTRAKEAKNVTQKIQDEKLGKIVTDLLELDDVTASKNACSRQ